MFSCGTKKNNGAAREQGRGSQLLDSPVTPPVRSSFFNDNVVPNRPPTGTPAPWTPRLSVLARVTQANKSGKEDNTDPIKPVFVAEFPKVVRDVQAMHKHVPVEDYASGGIDKSTSLAWIICGNRVFVWSYLSPASFMKCVVLEIPFNDGDVGKHDARSWLLCVINCDTGANKVAKHCNSAAVILCNQKTRAVVYWPDIYSQSCNAPVTSLASSDELKASLVSDGKNRPVS